MFVIQLIVAGEPAVSVGNVILLFTLTVVFVTQPLDGFVAVNVYVPDAFTVEGLTAFTNVPPFHMSVLPALVPVIVAVAFVQVIVPVADDDVMTGKVVFVVTAIVVITVHPFAGLIAITVYVPAAFTTAGFKGLTIPVPLHTNVLPALVAVNVALLLVHVILPELTTVVIIGATVLDIAATVAVLKHPFAALVAVTV